MNKLFILFLSIFTINAATGVKISDYPRATSLGNNDLFLLSYYSGGAYTTNKSITYTNFITQLQGIITGDMKKSSNLLDLANITISRSNLVAETRRTVNLRDIALPTGTTNDVATLNTALGMLPPRSGGIIYAGEGTWAFANIITQQNVTIRGMSHVHDNAGSPTLTNYFKPATNGVPVLQIGNDTGYVKGFALEDTTFYGSSVGSIGVYFAGGAFECSADNVTVSFFTNNWKFQGGVTYPCSIIHLNRIFGQPANVANSHGFYMLQTANYPTSWTTEISINNAHMDGPANNGHILESDSVEFKSVNSYFDCGPLHGWIFSHNFSPVPWADVVNVNIDGGNATNIVFESYNTNRYFFDQVTGVNFLVNGLWKPSSGALLTPPQTILRQNTMAGYLNAFGSINIINDTGGDFIGGNYTNHQIYVAGGSLFAKTAGSLKVDTGTGVFQVDSAPSTAVTTIRLTDTLNSRNADIVSSAGDIELKPASSGIKLQWSSGTVGAQQNATDGAFFFLNNASLGAGSSTTAGSLLFLDSNKQVKTNTSISISDTNVLVKGTLFVDNLVATNGITLGTGGTNLSVTGNISANGLLVTNTFTDNGAFITPTATISASDLNLAAGSLFTKNLAGNTVFTFSNPVEGQQFSVVITNGSTYTVTWPTVEWKGGTTPTQSVNQTDVYSFIYANGKYLGVQSPGSAPGVEQEAYSAGTVYSLTATAALLDFGTTDPTVTVTDAGTYLIYWGGNYKYNAATFVANQTANMKVRRTNNTAADISNATLTATTRVITTITDDLAVMAGKPVKYVAASGDILQVWGSLSATPSAGSVDCTDAWIILLRIQ